MYYQDDKKAFACVNLILDTLEDLDVENASIFTLQKLLYFAFGFHLRIYEEQLFDEKIQAWQNGIVVPSVYRAFKNCGTMPINLQCQRARIVKDFDGNIITPDLIHLDNLENLENIQKSLTIACIAYHNKDVWNLFNKTHRGKTSAWYKAYNRLNNKTLDNNDIIEEFRPYLRKLHKQAKREGWF